MSRAFTIRPAERGDETDICDMIHELALYEEAPGECLATPAAIKKSLFGRKKEAEAFVVHVAGEAAGFALYFQNYSTWKAKPGLYLEDLFVRPKHRKLGIGRALLNRLALVADERGCPRIEWAVLEWNELAKKQYRKIGAAPMDEWRTWRLTGDALRAFVAQAAAEESSAEESDVEAPAPAADVSTDSDAIVVYTDGGAQPNPGIGAWAAVLKKGSYLREVVGGELETTNNRMELMAAIKALEAIKRSAKVEMHTDSQYVRNGITSWITKWKKNRWMRGKNPVLNVDLWKQLDEQNQRHEVEWKWVRGHSGTELNERCDELCNLEISRLRSQKRAKSSS